MTTTFNLKYKKKDGLTLIYLKAYFKKEGKRFDYSTGESIHPKEWDFTNRQPNNLNGRTAKAESHRTIKRQLDRYSNHFTLVTELYKNTNRELTAELVRQEFNKEFKRVSVSKNKFYDAYDEFTNWINKAKELKSKGFKIEVSNILEQTSFKNGFDLADYYFNIN